MIDRLVKHAGILSLEGDSYRRGDKGLADHRPRSNAYATRVTAQAGHSRSVLTGCGFDGTWIVSVEAPSSDGSNEGREPARRPAPWRE